MKKLSFLAGMAVGVCTPYVLGVFFVWLFTSSAESKR